MGDRAGLHIYVKRNKKLKRIISFYRHWDGVIEGFGKEIHIFIKKYIEKNKDETYYSIDNLVRCIINDIKGIEIASNVEDWANEYKIIVNETTKDIKILVDDNLKFIL